MAALRLLTQKPLAAAGLGAAALWTLLALTSWSDLSNGPRAGSPWVVYDGAQAMLFTGPVQLAPVIGTVLLNLAAAIIGYGLVIRPIWGARGLAAPTWGVLAGVIPGSLLLIALARVVTLAAPHAAAPWILSLAALAGAGAIVMRLHDRAKPPSGRSLWAAVWPALLALGFALVMSVHLDRAHAAAEGSIWFISEVLMTESHGLGASGHWPLFSQHYDEATFLYPVVYGLVSPGESASGTLITMWWITLSVGRTGVAALAYLAVRNLGVDRLSALALSRSTPRFRTAR